jgi:broad specificity phosphatase PhoE
VAEIILVRHGRSAHVHAGWIDREGFLRWREAYEAAGIDHADRPPPELCEAAASAGVLISSNVRRAMESARLLAPGRELVTSPLLHELDLDPPWFGSLRLPLTAWALSYGGLWLKRAMLRQPQHSNAEIRRSEEGAKWLRELAEKHGRVVVVTHGSFRRLLASKLLEEGFRHGPARRTMRHWSAWTLTR